MIGAKSLVVERKEEILAELSKIKESFDLFSIFLSILELEDGFNLFVAGDDFSQRMLEDLFGINFIDSQTIRNGLIMRKEIIPLVKKYLGEIHLG